jgi:hypothetical protein
MRRPRWPDQHQASGVGRDFGEQKEALCALVEAGPTRLSMGWCAGCVDLKRVLWCAGLSSEVRLGWFRELGFARQRPATASAQNPQATRI